MVLLNQNSGYGQAILANLSSQVGVLGNIYVVMNSANSDEKNYQHMQDLFPADPDGNTRFFTSLANAYAACESNNNDVILLDANSSHSQAMITVSKSRVHFFGLDGGGRLNSQGTKISTPATSVAASVAVITNTGTRNTYHNIKFIQNGTNAAQNTAFHDTGEGTFCKNCSFHMNSLLSTASRSSVKFAGDTCHYEDCQIGNSTVLATAGNVAPLLIMNPARYSYFVNCKMISYNTQTTASCIDAPEADGVIGWIMFENCKLISANKGNGATAAGAMAEAVTSIITSGFLYFDSQCNAFTTTRFGEADVSIISAAIEPKANGTGGIGIVSA